MTASVEEFVELLSSEQHVDIARLRHLSRHGVHPAVRGEVWMYLLGVLSPDKSHEMTSVRALYNTYDSLLSSYSQPHAFSPQVSDMIRQEAERIWRHRVPHVFDSLQEEEQVESGAGLTYRSSKGDQGGLGRPLSRRTKTSGYTGPLRPVKPMNSKAASQKEVPEQTPSSRPAGSSVSPAALEDEELKQHFIKRIHNIVSVWIGRKAHDLRHVDHLNQRLLREVSLSEQTFATGSSGTGVKSATAAVSNVSLPAPPTAFKVHSPIFNSTVGSMDPSCDFREIDRTNSSESHSAWPESFVEAEGSISTPKRGRDHPERRESAGDAAEEPFDPAMGMGVEDDDLYGYTDDLSASLDIGHLRSRSRADSKRGTPRLGRGDLVASTSPGLSDEELRSPETGAADERQVGLGLFGPNHPTQLHSPLLSNKSRSQSFFSGRPSSPHSGHASPYRPRHAYLGSHSPSTRSHGSRSSIGSDDDDGESSQDETAAADIIDEEMLRIQEALWKPHLVQLASPFVLISGRKRVEAGIFFGFEKLMTLIEARHQQYPLTHLLATFHSLLRRTLPELRAYFDDEGLDVTPFVRGWLESLFSGQMRLTEGGCLRLWDAYFSSLPSPSPSAPIADASPSTDAGASSTIPSSSSTPLSLHLYVCLAILLHCKDTLEELDRSECESFLRGLPDLDVEKILNEAANLRLSHRQAILTCGEGEGDVDINGLEQGRPETESAIWREVVVERKLKEEGQVAQEEMRGDTRSMTSSLFGGIKG